MGVLSNRKIAISVSMLSLLSLFIYFTNFIIMNHFLFHVLLLWLVFLIIPFFSLSISISLFLFKLSFSSSFTYSPTFLKQMRTSVFESRALWWEKYRKPKRNTPRRSLYSLIYVCYYLYHSTMSVLLSFLYAHHVLSSELPHMPHFFSPSPSEIYPNAHHRTQKEERDLMAHLHSWVS